MNKQVAQHLAHAENRIRICQANALLWSAKEDNALAVAARAGLYKWVGIAQENNEQHF